MKAAVSTTMLRRLRLYRQMVSCRSSLQTMSAVQLRGRVAISFTLAFGCQILLCPHFREPITSTTHRLTPPLSYVLLNCVLTSSLSPSATLLSLMSVFSLILPEYQISIPRRRHYNPLTVLAT